MWKTLRKTFLFGLVLFGCAFGFLISSGNVNAESLPTASFGLYYMPSDNSSWTNKQGILYGNTSTQYTETYYGGYIRDYYWLTPVVNFSGNSIAIHFETNIVASLYRNTGNPFVNLDHLGISNCGSYTIANSTISSVVTPWQSDGRYNYTLTVYGDVVFSNVSKTSDDIRCTVSGGDYSFYDGPYDGNSALIYFERNPMTIQFSNNINDALLQAQINQNDTMINQNNIIIQGVGQTTDAINNLRQDQQATNDWLTDDTAPSVDTSDLGNSAGWLPAGPVDSILTLPINLLQGVVNVFTNPDSCQDVVLPLPFVNTNINLPCVGPILNKIGITPLWNFAGAIIGAFLIWNTLKWLYKFVDDTLTFRENNSSIWGGL